MREEIDAAMASRIDAAIDRGLGERRIVGAVVLVARDGALVYRRAAGLADREAGLPMREDTILRLASLTKPVVAATALAMVEQGLIALEAPVTSWLPDFRPRLPDGSTPEITIRHLLTHTSGLGYRFQEGVSGPYGEAGISDGLDQPERTLADNLARLAAVPLHFAPGTAWRYSLALDVLGAALAEAGGASLPELVKRFVGGPLGMVDTGFGPPPRERLSVAYADAPEAGGAPVPMAEPHAVPNGEMTIRFSPGRIFFEGAYPSGGGGMAGTAGDMLAFFEAIRTGGAPILSGTGAHAFFADAVPGLELPGSPGVGFSLGAAVLRDPAAAQSPASRGTIRWGGVYGHGWFIDPVRRLTVVSLTNTAIAGMFGPYPDSIRSAVYGT
jgi:CubicO group peptidase (beta-lactamase class C family)